MKKALLVALLALAVVAGAFADHPSGWGIGGGWSMWRNWNTSTYGTNFANDFGLSLKAPQLPIYWGVFVNFDSFTGYDYWGLGVTGDYYLIDKPLVPEIFMGWYAGIGGRVGLGHASWPGGASRNTIFLGARGVIGLDWQFPIGGTVESIEIFLDLAPSLGVNLAFGDNVGDSFKFPAGGWGWDLGVRFWL